MEVFWPNASAVARCVTPSLKNPLLQFHPQLDGDRTRSYVYCGVITVQPGIHVKAITHKSGMADARPSFSSNTPVRRPTSRTFSRRFGKRRPNCAAATKENESNMSMTSKEKALAALRHEEPDRTPRGFWALLPTLNWLFDYVEHVAQVINTLRQGLKMLLIAGVVCCVGGLAAGEPDKRAVTRFVATYPLTPSNSH
jgi:hypothetical protein